MNRPMPRKPKSPKATRLMAIDAWIDSAFYEIGFKASEIWETFTIFFRRFRYTGWKRVFFELLGEGFTMGAAGSVVMLALAMPAFEETEGNWRAQDDYAVTFLDRQGNEIGQRGIIQRESIPVDEMPDHVIKAVLATEDRRFFEHYGIDFLGLLRAMSENMRANSVVQGGSSLTQQLAKNLFLSNERTIERKVKEAFLAIWLEMNLSKKEILQLYLDRAYMGGGTFGITAAADFYFGKSVKDLNLAEAAMLAGLFKAPTRYAPHVDLAAARGRANLVLSNMVASGFLTEGQVTAARRHPATPIDRTADANSPNYFLDWAFEQAKRLIAENGFPGNNFIVRTTIDTTLQKYAEEAVISTVRESGERYDVEQAAMVVTDTQGAIRAMVGGMDYGKSQFNRAIVSTRQPGSAYKIFVYSEALEQLGLTPSDTITDQPVCISGWCPQNYGRNYKGRVTLASAFAQSLNTVPVTLSIKTGRDTIAELSHRMGLTADYPVTRSLALGVASVSVLDMTSSYAVLANRGLSTPAYGITRMTSLSGQVLYELDPNAPRERVLSEQTVAYMNGMMRGVITGGTGGRANVEGVPVVGKTGTTSCYRDAWFCGFTGNYVAAVWFGNDDYHPTNDLTGGTLPAIAWQKFMAYAHTNVDILPVFGVDFTPAAPIVAEADPAVEEVEVAQRPPSLTPEAAAKLVSLSELFEASLKSATPISDTASVGHWSGGGT